MGGVGDALAVENIQLLGLPLRRLVGVLPLGARRFCPSARNVDVARDGLEHHNDPLVLHPVVVGHHTTVGDDCRGLVQGIGPGDGPDLAGRHAAYPCGPLGGVAGQVVLELLDRHVGPLGDELLVVEAFVHQDVCHGQSYGAVGAGNDGIPLVAHGGRVAQPNVESHHPGPLGPGLNDPLGEDLMGRVGLDRVAAHDDDVLGAGHIVDVVVLAPGEFLGGPLGPLAYGCVVSDGLGAVGRQEVALYDFRARGLHPAVVEHEALRMALVAQLLQPPGDFVQGLVPADPLPLARAPRADAPHGVENPVGVVEEIRGGLALGADAAPSALGFGVAVDLEQAAVLDIADYGGAAHALPARAGDRLELATGAG